jgi:hypothetical protein
MDIYTIISAFLGAVFSFFLLIPIENQRKPKLSITLADFNFDNNLPKDKPARIIKVLRVKLINRKVKEFYSWWLKRESAVHCNVSIQLLTIEGLAPLFSKPVHGRWTNSDEPYTVQIDTNTRQPLIVFDPAKYNSVMTRNCFPGTDELIDIATRYDAEDECYIWNNDIYYKGWRNADLQIPKGTYYLIVTVYTAGEKTYGFFKLQNLLKINDFQLLNIGKDEIKKIKSQYLEIPKT